MRSLDFILIDQSLDLAETVIRLQRTSNTGGLISKESGPSKSVYEPVADIMSDLPEIRVPDSDARSSNSSLNSLPSGLANNKQPLWALNNLKMELSQKWQGFKLPGK